VLGIGFVARLSINTGGLFCLFALILIALGIFGSHTVKHKAAGINVDLWTGLAMLVFGGLMVFRALARPVVPEPELTRGEGSERIRRGPAT
jgi:TRAP-type C4-dicarboxylate transport system permease small subunit